MNIIDYVYQNQRGHEKVGHACGSMRSELSIAFSQLAVRNGTQSKPWAYGSIVDAVADLILEGIAFARPVSRRALAMPGRE